MWTLRLPGILVTAVVVAGCGQPPGAMSGASPDAGAPGAFKPVGPPPPVVVPTNGGPVLTAPSLVFAYYPGDSTAPQMADFLKWFMPSDFLVSSLTDYGVGRGTFAGAFALSGQLPTQVSDGQIQKALLDGIDSGRLPLPTAQSIYLIELPPGVQIGDVPCSYALGYHGVIPNQDITYVVVPACSGQTFDDLTSTASHEISEAATDPKLDAYVILDLGAVGEIGDLCNNENVLVDGYLVQREYSNTAALEGRDPCIPGDPAQPYFGIAVDGPYTVVAAAGSTVTVDALAFATAPLAGPMQIEMFQEIAAGGGDRITGDMSTGNPAVGQHVALTFQVPGGLPSGAGAVFDLFASDGRQLTQWPIAVYVQ